MGKQSEHEQSEQLATQRPRTTNDMDTYTEREEHLISQIHQPVDVKVFFRRDVQAEGSVRCKVCTVIDGSEFCVYVDCDDIVIKKKPQLRRD